MEEDQYEEKIVFHIKMLEEAGLIDAELDYIFTFNNATCRVKRIIGLTKQGSDYVKYIRSPWWNKAVKSLESSKKPLTLQLIYSICKELILEWQNHRDCQ